MGGSDDAVAGLTSFPPIPEAGLASVLASWSGRGSLFEALSAPQGDVDERQWNSLDVRRRANRILLAYIEPTLVRWPRRIADWLDYLPASKTRRRITLPSPFAGVAWAESRRRFGWPPSEFVGKEAQRGADMLAVQVLRWCSDKLGEIWSDSRALSPEQDSAAADQLGALEALLCKEPLLSATPLMPTRADLTALRREGAPWGSVATVAHELVEAEHSLDFLLQRLLIPDDEIRWRLFHLAVLGTVLEALRSAGCRLVSRRPLSPRSGDPNYEVTTPNGETYLLWFEASGVWSYMGSSSPFVEATRAVNKARRRNGADLLLLLPDERAFIVECKYSWNADIVARDGYYQAMAYAAEIRSRLAAEVCALAVGPEGTVSGSEFTSVVVGRVGTASPSALAEVIRNFMADAVVPHA
jgi:hypothetical protein